MFNLRRSTHRDAGFSIGDPSGYSPELMRRSKRLRARATINQLPIEILMEIFKFAHADAWKYTDGMLLAQGDLESQPDVNFFPYAVADVCPQWRHILLGVPQFWTSLRVLIGPMRTTSPEYFRAQLEATKYATPSSGITVRMEVCPAFSAGLAETFKARALRLFERDPQGTAWGEQAAVIRLYNEMHDHFYRITRLRICTFYQTSLPPIPRGHPSLQTVSFRSVKCQHSGGWNARTAYPTHSLKEPVTPAFGGWPSLTTLIIDGPSFVGSFLILKGMWRVNQITRLSISCLHDAGNTTRLNLDGLVQSLSWFPMLEDLRLEDISVPWDGNRVARPAELESLCLMDVDERFIQDLGAAVNGIFAVDNLTLVGCTGFHGNSPFFPPTTSIGISGMGKSNILYRLASSHVDSLLIHQSSCFDDEFLGWLTQLASTAPTPPFPLLERLMLVDCKFSVRLLQGYLQTRLRRGGPIPAISLYIAGKPRVGSSDAHWFASHTTEFKSHKDPYHINLGTMYYGYDQYPHIFK